MVRFGEGDETIKVRVDPTPTYRDDTTSFHDARIKPHSGWISAETHVDVAIDAHDNALDQREALLDLFAAWKAGTVDDAKRDRPFAGAAGYLRIRADSPYSISVHDGMVTTVTVRLTPAEDWIEESRQRLDAARKALASAPTLRTPASESCTRTGRSTTGEAAGPHEVKRDWPSVGHYGYIREVGDPHTVAVHDGR